MVCLVIVPLLLSFLLISASGELCPSGTYIFNGECNMCPLGSYQLRPDQYTCLRCPRGTYADVRGSKECKTCPTNHFTYFDSSVSYDDCVGPKLVVSGNDTTAEYFAESDFEMFGDGIGTIKAMNGKWMLINKSGVQREVFEGELIPDVDFNTFSKALPIINNEFCYIGSGRDYEGKADISEYTVSCLNWNDVPSLPNYNPNHNYCRSIGEYSTAPYCFIPGDLDPRAVLCTVPKCVWDVKCKSTAKGDSYQGKKSETTSGWECQNWSSDYPHPHSNHHVGNHNHCRNPDNEKDVWCYTWSLMFPIWDYCSVKQCVAGDDARYEY